MRMRVLIIEDEFPAAERLKRLVKACLPTAEIGPQIDSVEDAVLELGKNAKPDLIFMDVELADGLSFEIFREVKVEAPVIFVTAYDHYALKAFQVDGLHYVLKPIEAEALQQAIAKFQAHRRSTARENDYAQLLHLLEAQPQKQYKERFLIKQGSQLSFVAVSDVAWFQAQSGYVCLVTQDGFQTVVDFTLEQLRAELDPSRFFQVNRKFVLSIGSIQRIEPYFNHRLQLTLSPAPGEEVIVSRDRVAGFKAWLDR